jgi:L-ascorbate metabolism protein UlaG (beta-lactamase superfamily)
MELNLAGQIVLIDPWLDGNPVCPIKAEDIEKADVIAVSHGHFDHFGDAIDLCRRTGARLVSTPEIAWYMDSKGIKRGEQALPVSQGGGLAFAGFRVTMVPAVHASALYGEEWWSEKKFIPDGGAVGYMIQADNGVTIYHAGDTCLFSDMKLLAEMYRPDIALLPVAGRFTMDIPAAAIACQWLSPSVVIPMHFNTNKDLQIEIGDFVKAVKGKAPATEVVVMQPGETYAWDKGK